MPYLAVDELLGDDLNIAVALADRHQVRRSTIEHAPGIHEQWPGGNWEWIRQPSTEWAHGGPLIEREHIALEFLDDEWCAWAPSPQRGDGGDGRGPEPLVAAMRAYVASKFGDEIDLDSHLDGVNRPAS